MTADLRALRAASEAVMAAAAKLRDVLTSSALANMTDDELVSADRACYSARLSLASAQDDVFGKEKRICAEQALRRMATPRFVPGRVGQGPNLSRDECYHAKDLAFQVAQRQNEHIRQVKNKQGLSDDANRRYRMADKTPWTVYEYSYREQRFIELHNQLEEEASLKDLVEQGAK